MDIPNTARGWQSLIKFILYHAGKSLVVAEQTPDPLQKERGRLIFQVSKSLQRVNEIRSNYLLPVPGQDGTIQTPTFH